MRQISPLNADRSSGFSLIEMAIVLVILGLLLGGAMALIGPQREVQMVKDTEAEIQRTQEALIADAMSRPAGNLLCPDVGNAGQEGPRSGIDCISNEGWVPFAELGGVGRQDAWGNRLRYRVVPVYSRLNPGVLPNLSYSLVTDLGNLTAPLTPLDQRTLVVCNSANPACIEGDVASNVIAVILSHGRNGWGGRSRETGLLRAQPTGADELENTNGRNPADTADAGNTVTNRRFISHVPSPVGAPTGEFDDVVGWIPQGLFHSRMIAAGRLP